MLKQIIKNTRIILVAIVVIFAFHAIYALAETGSETDREGWYVDDKQCLFYYENKAPVTGVFQAANLPPDFIQADNDGSVENNNDSSELTSPDQKLYFYADSEGAVVTKPGWIIDDNSGHIYHANDKGLLSYNVIDDIDGKKYVFYGYTLVNGEVSFEGKQYITDEKGVIQTSSVGNNRSDTGIKSENQVNGAESIDVNNSPDGATPNITADEIVLRDGAYYYYNSSGILVKNAWVEKGGKKYYAQEDGSFCVYQMKTISGKTYCFSKSDGHVCVGPFSYKGSRYCADKDGVIKQGGWIEYKGVKYYAKKTGTLYRNIIKRIGIKDYCFSGTGSVHTGMFSFAGKIYFAGSDGAIYKSVLFTYNGKKFYSLSDGTLAKYNMKTISGKTYCFSRRDGHACTGLFMYKRNLYCADKDGVIKQGGWITYNGAKYYAKSNGVLYKYVIKTIGGRKYCFSKKDGHVCIGTFTFRGKKYTTNKYGMILEPQKTPLIDVSEFQYNIDWRRVKNSGINYAIIRAGYRGSVTGSLATDSFFHRNFVKAKRAGVKVGVYFFSLATTPEEGRQEAAYVINLLKKNNYKVDLPIVIDTEYFGGTNKQSYKADNNSVKRRTAAVKAFCEEVKARGYTPMIYASTSWLMHNLDMSKLPYQVWVAQYYYKCEYTGQYRIWQYSSTGRVPGISGNVDMNYIYY